MKTTGDKILDKTLDKIGGKGLFVKELDTALLENKVDITVHSLKDVPVVTDDRLPIIAYTICESPYDVLVLPKGINDIDFSKPIGSSSKRRSLQFKKLYPNVEIKPIRGNVETRLKKLDSGEFSALILAQAGLNRLGLSHRINKVFSEDEIIPSAGQGIIAVQSRKDDYFSFTKYLNDKNSEFRAKAERSFLKKLDGGCSSPIAAFARLSANKDKIKITGFYGSENSFNVQTISGDPSDAENLGILLAKKIKGDVLYER